MTTPTLTCDTCESEIDVALDLESRYNFDHNDLLDFNTELRFPDEFVRHKVLDLLGDLYLTGKFVQGKITAYLTGHTENLALVKFLLSMSGEA